MNFYRVSKFGGSSVANGINFSKVIRICKNGRKNVVVVSAPGKRFSTDEKITDLLIKAFFLKRNGNGSDFEKTVDTIRKRFLEICDYNGIPFPKKEIEKTFCLKKCQDVSYFVSRGEYLTAKIMSCALSYRFLDAKDCILVNKTESTLTSRETPVVIPGFYGRDEKGKIALFERGGGDLTGAIVAKSLRAKIYENWTDVDGIYYDYPNNTRKIQKTTYGELTEFAVQNSLPVQLDAVKILQATSVKMKIKNTFMPFEKGTDVVPSGKE